MNETDRGRFGPRFMVKEPIHASHPSADDPGPLHSEFRNDDDMRPIIRLFLEEVPDRIRSLVESRQAGDLSTFRRMVHQMKGAAGGYGFPTVTAAATHVERCLEASGPVWLEQSQIPFQALVNLLHRAHAGLTDLSE